MVRGLLKGISVNNYAQKTQITRVELTALSYLFHWLTSSGTPVVEP